MVLQPRSTTETSFRHIPCRCLLRSRFQVGESRYFEPKAEDIKGWKARQVVVFLEKLQALPKPLDKGLTQKMGQTYDLARGKNVEVVTRYFKLALMAKDEEMNQPTADLLGKVGRMKFVRPL